MESIFGGHVFLKFFGAQIIFLAQICFVNLNSALVLRFRVVVFRIHYSHGES